MSKDLQRQTRSEEVDILEIFNLIGRAIKSFFDFLLRIFNLVFKFLILLALFIRSNIKILVGAAILGLIIGVVSDYILKNNSYTSVMIVEPNFGVAFPLVNKIELYSELAQSKDSISLSSALGISVSDAAKIIDFKIEPEKNENEQLKLFNRFVEDADTMMLKNVTFDKFKDNLSIYDYTRYFITLEVRDKIIFNNAEDKILDLSIPRYLKELQKADLTSLDVEERSMNIALQKIDSLRNDYRKVMITNIDKDERKGANATNIYLGTEKVHPTNELQLFDLEKRYIDGLETIRLEKAIKDNVLNVVAGFEQVGIKTKDKRKYIIILVTVSIAFLVLILIELNKFLTIQERKIKNDA
ncbi:hypothetical protein M0G43_02895 [Subsaxibacter sp. CAU 1640]|uniref:hypothetical protein n=1 Tax=Subsaxibacter sp. CAU 1640 TaxID=2933271 RepID=UPI00200335F2|nr:hypothetical protein [Subsaxibacter sp. CAU 1640]MCK7589513.1 hypothetical protein [Subsaxibacter sp. CAU 1640]